MARQIGGLQARLEYTGVQGVVSLLRALPIDLAIKVGAQFGAIAMEFDRPNRPIALKNLQIAFPEITLGARMDIVRRMYRNWGRMMAEWAHLDLLDRSTIERFVTYEGKQHWDDAERVSGGKGLLVLTAHFGNWELLNVAHSIYGNKIAIIHRPLRNPLIDDAVCAARNRFGNKTIERKSGGIETMRLLRKNWMVGVALDLDVRKGVFVDFFGLHASTSDAVARLARATGAPVVPCFLVRQGDGAQHKIAIKPMVELADSGNRDRDAFENTERFVKAIEQEIRAYPDHWNWIH